jgi:hypothetical protein
VHTGSASLARALAGRAFERRVARLLGMQVWLAREALAAARMRRGERYSSRAGAFLFATAPLARRLLPHRLRARAIESFVFWLLISNPDDPRLVLSYAGHARTLSSWDCPVALSS